MMAGGPHPALGEGTTRSAVHTGYKFLRNQISNFLKGHLSQVGHVVLRVVVPQAGAGSPPRRPTGSFPGSGDSARRSLPDRQEGGPHLTPQPSVLLNSCTGLQSSVQREALWKTRDPRLNWGRGWYGDVGISADKFGILPLDVSQRPCLRPTDRYPQLEASKGTFFLRASAKALAAWSLVSGPLPAPPSPAARSQRRSVIPSPSCLCLCGGVSA